jgi:sulfatase-like protein
VHDRLRSAADWRRALIDGIHVAVLSSLAIAQPLFDLLGKNGTFFSAHNLTSGQIVLFGVLLTFGPPLLAVLAEILVGLIDPRLRTALHLAILGGLGALFVVQALKKTVSVTWFPWLAAVVVTAVAVAVAYVRLRPFRLFLTILAPAPIVFLLIFLFVSPTEKLVLPAKAATRTADVSARAPVVVVVLDEFPTTSMMDAKGQIDAARFPHLAELARRSTWFPNSTSVHEGTAGSVPAIYSGTFPRRGVYPTFGFYPHNLFTLLGRHYKMHVGETITHLCPAKLCGGQLFATSLRYRLSLFTQDVGVVYAHLVVPDSYEDRLPSTALSWTGFRRRVERRTGRLAMWKRFLDTIEPPHGRPTLNLIHIELPHAPFVLLPSCRQSATGLTANGLESDGDTWKHDWLATQQFQRHLLQLQCTDRLLGDLIDRMRRAGTYDKSLIVLTADEGDSFWPGGHRRALTTANIADIAFVPLFVKRPGQRTRDVDDHPVQGVDVLPTIADVLGIRIPWHVDGTSTFHHVDPKRLTVMYAHGEAHPRLQALLPKRQATLRRQVQLFGTGASLYRIGPHQELLGKDVSTLPTLASDGARGTIANQGLLRDLPSDPFVVPTPLVGAVHANGVDENQPVAVAVNGRVAAVGRTYREGSEIDYSLMAPERAFHTGRNHVQVFLVVGSGDSVQLRPVVGAGV